MTTEPTTSRVLTCVYCGHEYPQDAPTWGHQVLTDHVAQCEAHPMKAVVEERDRLRAALVGLVGEEDPVALRATLAVMARMPAPAGLDKAPMENAIRVLLGEETQTDG